MYPTLGSTIQNIIDQHDEDDHLLFEKIQVQLSKWKSEKLNIQSRPLHIKEVMEQWDQRKNELLKEEPITLPPSFWVEQMGSFKKGEIICIAGRPHMGKTASLLYLIQTIAKKHNTLLYSPDLSERALVQRMLCLETKFSLDHIQSGQLNEEMMRHLYYQSDQLYAMPLVINSDYFHNVHDYMINMESIIAKEKMEVVIIDNINSFEDQSHEHHPKQVNLLIDQIKKIAQKYKVTIIFTAPVSSSIEKEKGPKKPALQHLQPYGIIQQWADKIIFLYRPECYGYFQDENGLPNYNKLEWLLAKNKTGPTGQFLFDFNRNFGEIRELKHSVVSAKP